MRQVFVTGLSRTGTTLLTTILDSSPEISMGYELMPVQIHSITALSRSISEAIANGATDARAIVRSLGNAISSGSGVFIKRASRASIPPELLAELLIRHANEYGDSVLTLQERFQLANSLVQQKQSIEHTSYSGFKLPSSLVKSIHKQLDSPIVIAIVRDPRDTFVSQRSRGMTNSISNFCCNWSGFVNQVRRGQQTGDIHLVARYEDLVTNLQDEINKIALLLQLKSTEEMRLFYKSKASIHSPGQRHVNADELSKDVFSTKIGRWKEETSPKDVKAIERRCYKEMNQLGYATECNIKAPWLPRWNLRYQLKEMVKKLS